MEFSKFQELFQEFQFGYCSSSGNPGAFIEKGNTSYWLKLT